MSPVSKGKRLPRRVFAYSQSDIAWHRIDANIAGYTQGWADAKADTLQEKANALETMGKAIFKQRSST